MGCNAITIAECVEHESGDITCRYAHVLPSMQMEVVSELDGLITIYCGIPIEKWLILWHDALSASLTLPS